MTKTFALIGANGYIAPRHIKAIDAIEGRLVAACDIAAPQDPSALKHTKFFTDFDAFCAQIEKTPVDYIAICSPNHLHKMHITKALELGADVICEKPLVPDPADLDDLLKVEQQTGKRVYTILQLRYHEAIKQIRKRLKISDQDSTHDVEITYITSRDEAYMNSWKGDPEKSFGIVTNIGIHFFDMVYDLFGAQMTNDLYYADPRKAAGYLEHENATVKWFLSLDPNDLPDGAGATYRSVTCDGHTIDFSLGFTDLHTESYEAILAGRGFGIEDTRSCIQTTYDIRNATPDAGAMTDKFYQKLAA